VHAIWTAITTYRERGSIYLNLGTDIGDQGLADFKRYFGATSVSQPMGKKVLSTFGTRLHRFRELLRAKRS
jgi:hypothetical protein